MHDDEIRDLTATTDTHLGLQTAFRWWQSRWSTVAAKQAEGIRDSLLQEVFALRRNLELSLLAATPPDSKQLQQWIHTLEYLHQRLDRLSNQLSPPHQTDDLVLAIQGLLEYWQNKYPVNLIKVELLSQLKTADSEFNRIILFALEQLLTLIARIEDVSMVRIETVVKNTVSVLSVSVTRRESESPLPESVLAELRYLQAVLPILTCGQLISRPQTQGISYEFCWANLKPH